MGSPSLGSKAPALWPSLPWTWTHKSLHHCSWLLKDQWSHYKVHYCTSGFCDSRNCFTLQSDLTRTTQVLYVLNYLSHTTNWVIVQVTIQVMKKNEFNTWVKSTAVINDKWKEWWLLWSIPTWKELCMTKKLSAHDKSWLPYVQCWIITACAPHVQHIWIIVKVMSSQ